MVTALMVEPGKHPWITQLCSDSRFWDMAVSVGTDMQCSARIMELGNGVIILHAWEGLTMSLPGNRRIKKRIIPGVFYVVGMEKGMLRSLTDEEIVKYMDKLWKIQHFTEDEMMESWFEGIFSML